MRKGLWIFGFCLAVGSGLWAQTAVESYNEANTLAKAGQWEQAAQKYEAATQTDPNLWQAYQGLGNAYHHLGRDPEALKAYDKSLSLNPDNPALKSYADKVRANASPAPAAGLSATSSEASSSSSKAPGFFINFNPGFDYSFQGDIVEGLKDYQANLDLIPGYTTTNSTSTAGILGGLEFGMMFDKVLGISISPESVIGFGSKVEGVNGPDYYRTFINPNMVGGSLNLLAYLVNGQMANTYVKAGFCFYHAFVDYRVEDSFPSASWGTFTGEGIGGILEIGEEFDLGGNLSLGIAARGRLATIAQLVSPSPQGDIAMAGEPVAIVRDGNGAIALMPVSFIEGAGASYAALDMSGIQGMLNLKLSL